jgi:hypothetical protein
MQVDLHNIHSLVKSRDKLRELSKNPRLIEKYSVFDRALLSIGREIGKTINERKTKYILQSSIFGQCMYYTPGNNNQTHFYTELMENREFRNEFTEILKKEYPDCTIEYTEPRIENGKIIFPSMYIDWT